MSQSRWSQSQFTWKTSFPQVELISYQRCRPVISLRLLWFPVRRTGCCVVQLYLHPSPWSLLSSFSQGSSSRNWIFSTISSLHLQLPYSPLQGAKEGAGGRLSIEDLRIMSLCVSTYCPLFVDSLMNFTLLGAFVSQLLLLTEECICVCTLLVMEECVLFYWRLVNV